jgi:hypothetical protein
MPHKKSHSALFIGAFFVIAGMVSTQAETSLPPDRVYQAAIDSRTSVWDTSAGGDGQPLDIGEQIQPGDEQRSIVNVKHIGFAEVKPKFPNQTPGTKSTAGGPAYISGIRGMLYDIDFRAFDPLGSSPRAGVAYWEAGDRYQKGTDWIDTYTEGSEVGPVHLQDGYGGLMVLYDHNVEFYGPDLIAADPSDPFEPSGNGAGDGDWVENVTTGSPVDPSLPNKYDEYPSINDEAQFREPWLVMVLAPLPTALTTDRVNYPSIQSTDVLAEQNFELADSNSDGGGKGYRWGNVIGGSAADTIRPDVFGPGLDVRFDFDVDFVTSRDDADQWLGTADDPFGFATPEPTATVLLLLGLLGFLSVRRKRD